MLKLLEVKLCLALFALTLTMAVSASPSSAVQSTTRNSPSPQKLLDNINILIIAKGNVNYINVVRNESNSNISNIDKSTDVNIDEESTANANKQNQQLKNIYATVMSHQDLSSTPLLNNTGTLYIDELMVAENDINYVSYANNLVINNYIDKKCQKSTE